jgi:hyperosmotically inducible protein
MFRFLFKAIVFVVLLVAVVSAAAYGLGYWQAGGAPAIAAPNGQAARETARDIGKAVAAGAKDVGARVGEVVEDGALTAKIKSKMALDDYVKARSINIDTADGVVRLTGTVETQQERERAVRLARETEGVKEVRDAIVVSRPNGER